MLIVDFVDRSLEEECFAQGKHEKNCECPDRFLSKLNAFNISHVRKSKLGSQHFGSESATQKPRLRKGFFLLLNF